MRGSPMVLAVILIAAAAAAPMATSARGGLPDLADYDLMIDSPWAWRLDPGAENPDDPSAPRGTWTITPSPIRDGVLDMRVRLEAPDVALPVEPGPAILFTSVGLGGGLPGDIGYGRLESVRSTPLPACEGDPCVFETDVSVDLRRLPRMAAREAGLTSVWAEVAFTVLRTFGGGTWLQELRSLRPDGTIFSGTVSEPTPFIGVTPRLGLFPAQGATSWRDDGKPVPALQDELRDEGLLALDDSEPPATTDVRLVATFIGCDYKDSGQRVGASIRTTDGDLVTIPRPKGRDFVDATTPLPIGTTWRIGWVSDEVHPDGTRLAAQSAGTFTVGDRPLLATAAYRCREAGAHPVDGAVAEVIWPEPGPGTSASPAP